MNFKTNFSLATSLEALERFLFDSKEASLTREEEIDFLISDRKNLEDFLYTPWRSIHEEIEKREGDEVVQNHLNIILPPTTPDMLSRGRNMALARHIATPNYEMHRFMQCSDVIPGLQPVILEYTADKYVNVNTLKYALAELGFYSGREKETSKTLLDKISIINRNTSNGLQLNNIQTKTGTPLIDFHHTMFESTFPNMKNSICDLSEMYSSLGGRAKQYYKAYLSLFLKNNVLFENFLLNKEESDFMKTVVLPAFLEIIDETGHKPLVVNLGPTGNEQDIFWVSYPPNQKESVNKLLNIDS